MTAGSSPSSRPQAAGGPLGRQAEYTVARALAEGLARPVGIDIWLRRHSDLVIPDRDPCEHCDEQLALLRQFARLSPLVTITTYDLDRHASRAAEAGVEMAPTTIIRCGGRSVQFVGMSDEALLPALIDVMSFLSKGATPLEDASREVLASLTAPLHLELLVAPYDQFSAHMMRLLGALATESRLVRLRVIDATEYPIFASLRGVTSVPMLAIEGQRFTGLWAEDDLREQIRRIATGNADLVIRDQVYNAPFITEAAARRRQAESAAEAADVSLPPPGGLYIPGRD